MTKTKMTAPILYDEKSTCAKKLIASMMKENGTSDTSIEPALPAYVTVVD
jgi:hypothetical protein